MYNNDVIYVTCTVMASFTPIVSRAAKFTKIGRNVGNGNFIHTMRVILSWHISSVLHSRRNIWKLDLWRVNLVESFVCMTIYFNLVDKHDLINTRAAEQEDCYTPKPDTQGRAWEVIRHCLPSIGPFLCDVIASLQLVRFCVTSLVDILPVTYSLQRIPTNLP